MFEFTFNAGKNCRWQTLAKMFGYLLLVILFWELVFTTAWAGSTNVETGVPDDIVIAGKGWFVLRDVVAGEYYVTRFGYLTTDANGYLVNSAGFRVQGFIDSTEKIIGDLKMDSLNPSGSSASIMSYQIQENGQIPVTLADGSSFVRARLLLQNFTNPSALTRAGDRFFQWTSAAGPLPQAVAPGTQGTGSLETGQLELLVPELQLARNTGPSKTFSQGLLIGSGISLDLAIQGEGFFILRRTNDNALFATRSGAFYLDGQGYMIHYSGFRLQGYSDSTLSTVGDVQITADDPFSPTNPAPPPVSFEVSGLGGIIVHRSDGSAFIRGQILLAGCTNTSLITRTNFDIYPIATNFSLWSLWGAPETQGLGKVVQGFLESSQFDSNLLAVRSNINFFNQGSLVTTTNPANLGISGAGFFTVRDPVKGVLYATRNGAFQLDGNGYLVLNGCRLQGFNDASLSQSGDMRIDSQGSSEPSLNVGGFSVDWQGRLNVTQTDGTTFVRGQITLQTYRDLQALKPFGNRFYSNIVAAIPVFTNGQPGMSSLGVLFGSALELPPAGPPAVQPSPSGGLRLYAKDLPSDATVQSSSDLIHWNTIGTMGKSYLNDGEFFDNPQSANRYYRIAAAHQ